MVSLAGLASLAGYACPQSSICNLKSAIFPLPHFHPCKWNKHCLVLKAAHVAECQEIVFILVAKPLCLLAVFRSV